MGIDVTWAMAPDELQGAAGYWKGTSVYYDFPRGPASQGGQITMNGIDLGVQECHVHLETGQRNTAHVTWELVLPNGRVGVFYQWYRVDPATGGHSYDSNAGVGKLLEADPSLEVGQFSAVDAETEPWSTMLVADLAGSLVDRGTGYRTAGPARGVPLGWGVVPFRLWGADAEMRGSDAVYTFTPPVAAAAGWTVLSSEVWLSPSATGQVQVSYQLQAPAEVVSLEHYFQVDTSGGASASGVSMSADGSAVADAAGAQAASDALAPSSLAWAKSIAGELTPP
jgi:hypothetical protein